MANPFEQFLGDRNVGGAAALFSGMFGDPGVWDPSQRPIPGAPREVQPKFWKPDPPPRRPDEPPQRLYNNYNDRDRVRAYITNQLQTIGYWEAETASVKYLKQACNFLGIPTESFSEKSEYIKAVNERRNKECSICMEDFKVDEPVKVTHCGHLFHEDCLQGSAVTQSAAGFMPKCAMCRTPIDRVNEHADKVKRKNEATEEARKSRKV